MNICMYKLGIVFPHLPGEGPEILNDFIRGASCPPPPPSPYPPAPQPRAADSSGGLKRERRISVGTAGPQPRAPDLTGHCRTSTASAGSQWALPDLNRERRISVGTAGPQPRAPDLNVRENARIDARDNVRIDARKDAR